MNKTAHKSKGDLTIDTSNVAGMHKLMKLYGKDNSVFTGSNDDGENTITSIHADRIVIKTLQPNNWIRVNTYYDDETMEETYTR